MCTTTIEPGYPNNAGALITNDKNPKPDAKTYPRHLELTLTWQLDLREGVMMRRGSLSIHQGLRMSLFPINSRCLLIEQQYSVTLVGSGERSAKDPTTLKWTCVMKIGRWVQQRGMEIWNLLDINGSKSIRVTAVEMVSERNWMRLGRAKFKHPLSWKCHSVAAKWKGTCREQIKKTSLLFFSGSSERMIIITCFHYSDRREKNRQSKITH